jgi:hypothetical protein
VAYQATPNTGIYTQKQLLGPQRKRMKNGDFKVIPMHVVNKKYLPKKLSKMKVTPDLLNDEELNEKRLRDFKIVNLKVAQY